MADLVDSKGNPLRAAPPRNGRARMGLDGQNASVFPYDAAQWQTAEMGDWTPWIRSPDAEINQFRDRMVARNRDLVRNDGWASGAINRILDNTIGPGLRLSANPDWRALSLRAKGFDAKWADEFRRTVEALWREYSVGTGRYNDVSRIMTMGDQFRLALRHELVDGESLIVSHWLPERMGYGGADYATSFMVIDPDRLSNPYQMVDSKYLRGGVEIDDYGVPLAYHIRKAHQNDWYNSLESMDWERVLREDDDGWRRVIHNFDHERAGQNRGTGIFTPVLARMKMLARYYGVELQAATIASVFGTYVTSPYDPALVQDALDGDSSAELGKYQQVRADWATERPAMLNGARIPTLAPGEEINSVSSAHPHGGFGPFAKEMLRSMSAASGLSAEQITQDYSATNYSSSRAAVLESWKTLNRRMARFKSGTATPMYAVWLQEVMERGLVPLPAGAPSFIEAATAYSACHWLGAGRGWVDPVKEPAGSILKMDGGLSTLKQECAEQGLDYEEVIAQRAIELAEFDRLKIPRPSWANMGEAAQVAAMSEPTPEAD